MSKGNRTDRRGKGPVKRYPKTVLVRMTEDQHSFMNNSSMGVSAGVRYLIDKARSDQAQGKADVLY